MTDATSSLTPIPSIFSGYIDYAFYTGVYLGNKVSQTEFAQLALRASKKIDVITFNRVSVVVETGTDTDLIANIKLATCAVMDLLKDVGEDSGGIQSETIGSSSVTYTKDSNAYKTTGRKIQIAASEYLGSTDLMFQGLKEDE
jgi:hypothetical protein